MAKEESMVIKYAVLSEVKAQCIDINNPKTLSSLKLYDDLEEAKRVCIEKDKRYPTFKYAVYVIEYVIYLFKKYKDGEIQNGQIQVDT